MAIPISGDLGSGDGICASKSFYFQALYRLLCVIQPKNLAIVAEVRN